MPSTAGSDSRRRASPASGPGRRPAPAWRARPGGTSAARRCAASASRRWRSMGSMSGGIGGHEHEDQQDDGDDHARRPRSAASSGSRCAWRARGRAAPRTPQPELRRDGVEDAAIDERGLHAAARVDHEDAEGRERHGREQDEVVRLVALALRALDDATGDAVAGRLTRGVGQRSGRLDRRVEAAATAAPRDSVLEPGPLRPLGLAGGRLA